MLARAGVLLAVLPFFSSVLPAQEHLRVAVAIQDDSVGGVVSSVFRSALRSIGDVDVVTIPERPDFVLQGIAMCEPSCDGWVSLDISLRLWSPLDEAQLGYELAAAGIKADAAALGRLAQMMSQVEVERDSWVLSWGRNRYENAARQLVGQVDSQCFESRRTIRRIARMPEGLPKREAIASWVKTVSIC